MRPRHQNKDYERLMQQYEAKGWSFEKRAKHWFGKCSCGNGHMVTISSTPRTGNLNSTKRQLRACDTTKGTP